MRTLWPAMIIFSMDHPKCGPQRYRDLLRRADAVSLQQGSGSYKGRDETSFLAHADQEAAIRDLCARALQECYLYLHPDRGAELRDFFGKTIEHLAGRFQEIPREQAMQLNAFSCFQGKYWGVV